METKAQQLLILFAAGYSLLAAYLPWLKVKFDELPDPTKQLAMAGLILLTAAAMFGLSCAGKVEMFVCTGAGAWDALSTYVLALAINAGIYKATNKIGSRGKPKSMMAR